MPTKRRITRPLGLGDITMAQRVFLETGFYYFDNGPDDRFRDEDHRRETWRRHREEILAEWRLVGERPVALWEFDAALARADWPRCWDWPNGIRFEAEMVYRLLENGRIEPCVPDELARIEARWLERMKLVADISRSARNPDPPWLMRAAHAVPTFFQAIHWERICAELPGKTSQGRRHDQLSPNGDGSNQFRQANLDYSRGVAT